MSKKNYFAPMHTAEHILNRTMVDIFGCERSNNCHIERKKSKCDFVLEQEPSQEQINEIETKINEVINKNLPVSHKFIDFDLAKAKFKIRVTKNENPKIRITSIGDYDNCPCIGEHVENTSEVGNFKITTTSYNNKIFRLRYKLLN